MAKRADRARSDGAAIEAHLRLGVDAVDFRHKSSRTSGGNMRLAVVAIVFIFVIAGAPRETQGQPAPPKYPNQVIRMVVPFTPGASTDVTARLFAPHLSAALGQQVIIDNRGGAGGGIGAELVAKAEPRWLHAAREQSGTVPANRSAPEGLAIRRRRFCSDRIHRLFAFDCRSQSEIPAERREG